MCRTMQSPAHFAQSLTTELVRFAVSPTCGVNNQPVRVTGGVNIAMGKIPINIGTRV